MAVAHTRRPGVDRLGRGVAADPDERHAAIDGGRKLVISNDSDFGIAGTTGSTAPFTLTPKVGPGGTVDAGEFLVIDLTKLQDPTSTATVTLRRK